MPDDDLDQLLRRQAGVVTWAQARAAGMSQRRLTVPGRSEPLVRVRAGAYADAAAVAGHDEAQQAALTVAAGRLVSGVDLVATGLLAAAVHGLPVLGWLPERPLLSERKPERPRHRGRSTSLPAEDVVEVHGVPVTSLPRTAVDVARSRGFVGGVITADGVLARGIPREQLERVLERSNRWPGVQCAERVVAFADGRSESALESYGRVRFCQAELPPPELQVCLGDEFGVIGRVDMYWAEHRTVAEADGAVKYARPGSLFAEKQREGRLREAGFEVVRFTWDEVAHRPQLVIARVLRAFERASHRRAS